MDFKIIKSEDLKENDYDSKKVTEILKVEGKFDIAKVVRVSDNVKTGYNSEGDTAYYVLEGEGDAVVNGIKYRLKKGDCVYYPKGTKYKHLKGLTLLAISCPPFDSTKYFYSE